MTAMLLLAMFENEKDYYASHRDELLRYHVGKYALIKGDQLVGTYDTEEAACRAGVGKFGLHPFFIKLISEDDDSVKIPALTLGLINANS